MARHERESVTRLAAMDQVRQNEARRVAERQRRARVWWTALGIAVFVAAMVALYVASVSGTFPSR
jgi:cytochrome c oxidase assembly factor CtaG